MDQSKDSVRIKTKFSLAIHGGAGNMAKKNLTPEKEAEYKAKHSWLSSRRASVRPAARSAATSSSTCRWRPTRTTRRCGAPSLNPPERGAIS